MQEAGQEVRVVHVRLLPVHWQYIEKVLFFSAQMCFLVTYFYINYF